MFQEYVDKMQNATNAKQRRKVVQDMCRMFAFSTDKAYKVLKSYGWESGRKTRKDAGTSSVSENDISTIEGFIANSVRKNGKVTMPLTVARSVLEQNGIAISVSNSRLNQIVSKKRASVRALKKASPYQKQRTLYPNQVHLCDPSVSLLFFAPNGKQRFVRDDEQYKNKNFLEDKDKCWRYVLTDHYSSSICVRYYASKGESAHNLYDFLLYAWGQKQNSLYGFHGLPELLVWDCGSANTSKAVSKALEALRVETKPHLPGNPRAKGQVENANNIVETHFECLLKLESVHSIDELNDAAERWCAAYNANMIDGFDSSLSRAGRKIGTRLMLWNRIEEQQLRELPDDTICRQIFTSGVFARKVAGDLTVSIQHPKTKRQERYSVAGMKGIMVDMTVNVQPVLVDIDAVVIVSYQCNKELISEEVRPIEYDEVGFELEAAIIGKEYKQKPDTEREEMAKKMSVIIGEEGSVPFASVTEGKGFKTHSLINATSPFAIPMVGSQISVNTVQIHDIQISTVECAKRVKAQLGYLPDGFLARLNTLYPDKMVSHTVVQELVQEIISGGFIAAIKEA